MKLYKHELQNIISRDGPESGSGKLKKTQNFLRRNAPAGIGTQKQERFKSEEEAKLIAFAREEDLFYLQIISEDDFIAAGAEQRVYRYDDFSVIKLNDSIFYASWLDYMNSLLIHNYFFKSAAYELLGFQISNNALYAVVKQDFIVKTAATDLNAVKEFLVFNEFINTKNNDYYNSQLGIIFEDLHDENVLTRDNLLYFIDTVFYLTEDFYV